MLLLLLAAVRPGGIFLTFDGPNLANALMLNKTKLFHVATLFDCQSLDILSVYFKKFSDPTQIFCQPTSSSLLKQVSYKLVDVSQK